MFTTTIPRTCEKMKRKKNVYFAEEHQRWWGPTFQPRITLTFPWTVPSCHVLYNRVQTLRLFLLLVFCIPFSPVFFSLNFPPACCCDTIISSNRWLNCCQALSIPRATVTMLGTEKSRLTACRIRFECNWNGQNAAKIVCQRDARVILPLVVSSWMLDNRLNEILGRNL